MADPSNPTEEQAEDYVPGRIYGGPPPWAFKTPRELMLEHRENLRAKQKAKAKQARRQHRKMSDQARRRNR